MVIYKTEMVASEWVSEWITDRLSEDNIFATQRVWCEETTKFGPAAYNMVALYMSDEEWTVFKLKGLDRMIKGELKVVIR